MKAAQLFVKALEAEGVEYIFGLPGEENLEFLDALSHSKNIKFILVRHEQAAAFMADVYGRLTGKPGVCLSTLGPGAANLVTGIADAYLDRAPVVAITAQGATTRLHKESHQHIDIVQMFRPITKWNISMTQPEIIAESVRKAFKIACMEKPGATHLELPEDVARRSVEDTPIPPTVVDRPGPSETAIQRAMAVLKKAKHPLMLVGNGVARKGAHRALALFLDRTGIAAANTFMAKGTLPVDYAYNLHTVGMQARDYVACAFDYADTVLAIGYDLVEYAPSLWNQGNKKTIIHIDFESAEVDEHYHANVEIVGDITDSLFALARACADFSKPDNTYYAKLRKSIVAEFARGAQDAHFPLRPQRILADIRKALAPNDILISDVGAHKVWVARMYRALVPNTCIISNGFASMGIALPGALAAQIVHPNRKVIAVCGDGGFLMNVQDLETAVRLKLPVVIVVWHDNRYGLVEWKQMAQYGHSQFMEFGNPDFVKLAESFGARAARVKKASDFLPMLAKAFRERTRPTVIDVPVDYRENFRLTKRLGHLACTL